MIGDDFISNIIQDVKVELTDEFDRNFERKGFFDQRWPPAGREPSRGSLMQRTGALRRSIQARDDSHSITWSSHLSWAEIHNEGGEIAVTKAMKGHFWMMYYQAIGGKNKSGNKKSTRGSSRDAEFYKAMALKRVGENIKIPQRRFIGLGPEVDALVQRVADENFKSIEEQLTKYH